jgi:hypothetical protein
MTPTARKADCLPPPQNKVTITEVADPAEAAHLKEIMAAAALNHRWLAAHWGDLMPACLGKYVAVANQTAFLADTAEEANTWARAHVPHDPGWILEYVPTVLRPTIYADRG